MEAVSSLAVLASAEDAGKQAGLTVEERNLLSVAVKKHIGARRASWRVVCAIEQREAIKGNKEPRIHATKFRKKVEVEIAQCCGAAKALIEEVIVPITPTKDREAQTLYLTVLGDLNRYLYEVKYDKKYSEAAETKYKDAMSFAEKLRPTHVAALGAALNYSVFLYEVKGKMKKAIEVAMKAFETAINNADDDVGPGNEESYRDVTVIMQLLRDNVTLWCSDATVQPE